MLSKAVKIPLICSGILLINLGLSTNIQTGKIQLGRASLALYEPILSESELMKSESQGTEVNGFSCNIAPESSKTEVQPPTLAAELSFQQPSLFSPQLVAQATSLEISPIPAETSDLGEIVSAICSFEGAAVGGGASSGISPLIAAAPLPLLSIIPLSSSEANRFSLTPDTEGNDTGNKTRLDRSSGNSTSEEEDALLKDKDIATVPEPITIFGTGLALGFGALMERKRKKIRQK